MRTVFSVSFFIAGAIFIHYSTQYSRDTRSVP